MCAYMGADSPITGCVNTKTVYVKVPAAPLPANLTAETPQPSIPNTLTYGASLDLNVSLLAALGQCNLDKAAMQRIDNQRPEYQRSILKAN